MKKLLSSLLTIVLCVSLLPSALAETVTLSELKQQAPERLQMTVTTDAGETVEVDAPVILPPVEVLPVLLCKSQLYDMSKVDEIYPLKKGTGSYNTYHNSNASDHDPFVFCAKESKNYLLRGKTDSTARYPLPAGATPAENDFTLEEALALIKENNALFGGDPNVDLRIDRAAAMSGLCRMRSMRVTNEATGVSFGGIKADPEQPVKGKEKGLWEIELAQYMRWTRVLDHSSGMAAFGNGNFLPDPTHNVNRVMDENNFSLAFGCLREERELPEAVLFADWATVEDSIRDLIQRGELKSVYQLELVYFVKITREGSDAILRGEYDQEMKANMDYVLVPGWEIRGFGRNRRNDKYFDKSSSPDRDTVLMNGVGDDWFQDDYIVRLNGDDASLYKPEEVVYDLEESAQ